MEVCQTSSLFNFLTKSFKQLDYYLKRETGRGVNEAKYEPEKVRQRERERLRKKEVDRKALISDR